MMMSTPRKVTTMTTTTGAWLWSAGAVLGLLLCVPSALAGLEHRCDLRARHQGERRGVCGRNLADIVRLVCMERGGISGGGHRKRDVGQFAGPVASSGNDVTEDTLGGTEEQEGVREEEGTLRGLVLNRQEAFSYLQRKKRSPHDAMKALGYFRNLPKRSSYGQQGIVCECCVHQCTFSELAQYCRM